MLSIVSTPIGNLDDITIRAIKTLSNADIILCEDTRHTGLMLHALSIPYKKLLPYHDEIENKKLPEIIDLLMQGNHLALVSDAGTPLISDPGFTLVRECLRRNIKVETIPGPSAVIAALTVSGLPTDKFMFLGYVHSKNFKYIQPGVTAIFYEAPHKLLKTLEEMRTAFGDIEICLVRELTKIHEEIWKGKISEAITKFENPKGEFVLLFSIPT